MDILYTSTSVREVKKYTVPEFVHYAKDKDGITEENVNEFWGQEGKQLRHVYQATDTINEDEVLESCYAGVEFTDGVLYLYGCKQDQEMDDESSLTRMLLLGLE